MHFHTIGPAPLRPGVWHPDDMKALTYIVLTQLCLAVLMVVSSSVSSYIAAQRYAQTPSDIAARYLGSTETCVLISICAVLFSILELWFIRKVKQ